MALAPACAVLADTPTIAKHFLPGAAKTQGPACGSPVRKRVFLLARHVPFHGKRTAIVPPDRPTSMTRPACLAELTMGFP